MRTLVTLTFCVFVMTTAVAIADEIKRDYDHTTNFSKYKTFMWITEPKPDNPLMKQRIIDAVNNQLELRGLRLVTENGDLGVAANAATREEHSLETFYDGFPGWGWYGPDGWYGPGWGWGYWGPATTQVYTYEVGTLVVDLVDSQTKQVVWWGSATDTVSSKPEKNTKKLRESVGKMFKYFPPISTTREG